MDMLVWICQLFLVVVFGYSGVMKATQPEPKLVAMGQTGVEGLPVPLIRFIGITELLGVVGLLVPVWSGIMPVLTPIAALSLGAIMIPAAVIHYRRNEKKTVWLNVFIFFLCLVVFYARLFWLNG